MMSRVTSRESRTDPRASAVHSCGSHRQVLLADATARHATRAHAMLMLSTLLAANPSISVDANPSISVNANPSISVNATTISAGDAVRVSWSGVALDNLQPMRVAFYDGLPHQHLWRVEPEASSSLWVGQFSPPVTDASKITMGPNPTQRGIATEGTPHARLLRRRAARRDGADPPQRDARARVPARVSGESRSRSLFYREKFRHAFSAQFWGTPRRGRGGSGWAVLHESCVFRPCPRWTGWRRA